MASLLIFDSGVGGLSIATEIRQRTPELELIYVADNRNYPYGNLSEEALLERVSHLFPALLSRFQPDGIVIACNSASTLVLDRLRAITDIPIIGVVPAIKPAAKLTQTQHIGLLATPGTVQRAYTDRLIQAFAHDCQVTRIGTLELVEEAEKKLRGLSVDTHRIEQILTPCLTSETLDVLVLGCTHFPFLHDEIRQILGDSIEIIDSGEAIARRTEHVLRDKLTGQTNHHSKPHGRFLLTQNSESVTALISNLHIYGFYYSGIINH